MQQRRTELAEHHLAVDLEHLQDLEISESVGISSFLQFPLPGRLLKAKAEDASNCRKTAGSGHNRPLLPSCNCCRSPHDFLHAQGLELSMLTWLLRYDLFGHAVG